MKKTKAKLHTQNNFINRAKFKSIEHFVLQTCCICFIFLLKFCFGFFSLSLSTIRENTFCLHFPHNLTMKFNKRKELKLNSHERNYKIDAINLTNGKSFESFQWLLVISYP